MPSLTQRKNFANSLSCRYVKRIFHVSNISSAVILYGISYIHFDVFIFNSIAIMDSYNDQLPVGLIGQLVEQ